MQCSFNFGSGACRRRRNTAGFRHRTLKGDDRQDYLDTIAIERLHRRCLEVIKTELDRSGVRDINIQSLILFNIGEEGDASWAS